jgi:DNA-binding NtrC family response regulator
MMKGKICIVDHDLASRGYLRECLEREGHNVLILNDGFQLRPFLSRKNLSLFILNIDSPGVRERNLLVEIKKAPESRVLLIVSEREDVFLKEAIELGVYGFIHRPFDIQEVCAMVNHLAH